MKRSLSSKNDEQHEKIVRLLEELGSVKSEYPSELLTARRAAFLAKLAQLEVLRPVDAGERLSAGEQEVVRLLGQLKAAPVEYPPGLLAARRSAFLRQASGVGETSLLDRFRLAVKRLFPYTTDFPAAPAPGVLRVSLVVASLLLAVLLGSLLFNRARPVVNTAPSEVVAAPTQQTPPGTGEVTLTICPPEDQSLACQPGELSSEQDLADPGNGRARPAVSKDAGAGEQGVHRAANVNDGRPGESWVSNSLNSWIKIDLGRVTTINTISLQKASLDASADDDLGQFVIAVALSDVYSDGNSLDDYREYAQVFSSEQTGFDGTVSPRETILTRFSSTRARYIKITFEEAGAAIQDVGVFMVPPPTPGDQFTSTPPDDLAGMTVTPAFTSVALLSDLATSTGAPLPTATGETVLIPMDTLPASGTPLPPASTGRPADTATPLPTDPLPSETPIPLPTTAPPTAIPPTVVPPTDIPPTIQLPPASTDPIVVTGNAQTLTFTCNGNEAMIRGHANIVSLLGSCRGITVTGNENLVFYESGSPLITDRGRDNIITRR